MYCAITGETWPSPPLSGVLCCGGSSGSERPVGFATAMGARLADEVAESIRTRKYKCGVMRGLDPRIPLSGAKGPPKRDGRDKRAFTPVFDGLCPAMTVVTWWRAQV